MSDPDELWNEAQKEVEAERLNFLHEAHGGDENPDRDECQVCIDDLDFFLKWGESRPR